VRIRDPDTIQGEQDKGKRSGDEDDEVATGAFRRTRMIGTKKMEVFSRVGGVTGEGGEVRARMARVMLLMTTEVMADGQRAIGIVSVDGMIVISHQVMIVISHQVIIISSHQIKIAAVIPILPPPPPPRPPSVSPIAQPVVLTPTSFSPQATPPRRQDGRVSCTIGSRRTR